MRLTKYICFLILGFSISTLLTACGSKGDLYQPEEPHSVKKAPTNGSQPMSHYNAQQNTKSSKKKSY